MVDIKSFFEGYRISNSFASLVNIACVASDKTFLTKSGEVIAAICFRGPDAECREREVVEASTAMYRSALRLFDERFVVSTYLVKRSHPALDLAESRDPIVAAAQSHRKEFLSRRGEHLYGYEAVMTISLTPQWKSPNAVERLAAFWRDPLGVIRESLGVKRSVQQMATQVEEQSRQLIQAVEGFLGQAGLDAHLLNKDEAFSFYRRILNPNPIKAAAIRLPDDDVSFALVDSQLECYRDHLRIDDYFVKTLTMKQLPAQTYANILDDLTRTKSDLVIATEWRAMDSARATAKIRSRRRHAHNTKLSILSHAASARPYERELLFDESKEAIVQQLGDCLTAIEMNGVQLGQFSISVVVIGKLIEEVQSGIAEVMKIFGRCDGSLNEERYNGLNAYLATLPAGYPYNLRRLVATNENHADMISWFPPATGERWNTFLNAPSLAVLETEDQSLFHFNLHVEDVAHTLVLGKTGSGKSFLLNFLLTYVQHYTPYTFILDIGGSYRWFTDLHQGAHIPFRLEERPYRINPFSLPPTPSNLEFLFNFSRLLIESDGYRMSDFEARELYEAVRAIYVLEKDQRRLLSLSMTVPANVGQRLRRWTEGEQYGAWFDNIDDTVTFSKMQYIDFEGMDRLGTVLEPLLFYLLHRISEFILDPALATVFKIAVVDEAWLFLKNRTTCDYILNAMRTWRKRNAAMILSTQSLDDLAAGDSFRPILDSCPTKLLLSSPSLDAAFYGEKLRLTSVEIEKVRHLVPKKQFLLKREGLSKVLNLNVDPRSYWLFTTNPYEAKRRQELADAYGLSTALEILAGGSQ